MGPEFITYRDVAVLSWDLLGAFPIGTNTGFFSAKTLNPLREMFLIQCQASLESFSGANDNYLPGVLVEFDVDLPSKGQAGFEKVLNPVSPTVYLRPGINSDLDIMRSVGASDTITFEAFVRYEVPLVAAGVCVISFDLFYVLLN